MPRLLIKYSKGSRLRFISHLDLAKSIERALRRSGLPSEFTAGFHPKPKLSFGPALPLGASSTSEYLIASLREEVPPEAVLSKLNSSFPEGLRAIAAEYISEKAPSLGRAIELASYAVFASTSRQPTDPEVRASIAGLFERDELVVEKKSGFKAVRRSEAVVDVVGEAVEGGAEFEFLLTVGRPDSVRPDSLASLMLEGAGEKIEIVGVEIERTGLFASVDGKPVDLFAYYKA